MNSMKRWRQMAAVLMLACFQLAGCVTDIDSDTLVRELRILSMRIGSTDTFSVADAQAEVKLGPGGLDGTIRTIDVASAQLRCPQSDQNPAHQDAVTSLVQSPRGPLLASGGRDKQISLWQIDGDSGCLTLAGMLPQLHSAGVATVASTTSGSPASCAGRWRFRNAGRPRVCRPSWRRAGVAGSPRVE